MHNSCVHSSSSRDSVENSERECGMQFGSGSFDEGRPEDFVVDTRGNQIHSSAVVYPGAKIGYDNIVHAGAVIYPGVTMQNENTFFPYAVVGSPPQSVSEGKNLSGACLIGSHNSIREYATINSGGAVGQTVIGNDCIVMAYAHIGHHAKLHNRCVVSNAASIAGFVTIFAHAIVGANALVHQKTVIGAHAFLLPNSILRCSLKPFALFGNSSEYRANRINIVALRRLNGKKKHLDQVKKLSQEIYVRSDLNDKLSEYINFNFKSFSSTAFSDSCRLPKTLRS